MNPIDYLFENLYRNAWGLPGAKAVQPRFRPARRRWTLPERATQ